jgi:uncharacterized membrane protein
LVLRAVITKLMKAGTLAMLNFGVGFGVAFAVTGSAERAMEIALLGSCLGSFLFLLNERLWGYPSR